MNHSKEKYRLIFFLPLILFQLYCNAQTSNYSIKTYTVKDGMPDQYVLSLYQDSRGFIWIGSANGLSRFDGSHFINYGFQQGISCQRVQNIMEDKDHRLWIAAEDKLFELKQDHFISHPFSDSADHPFYIYDICQLRDGRILAFTKKGDYSFNGKSWQRSSLLQTNNKVLITKIIQTDQGDYYNCGDALIKKEASGIPRQLWKETDKRIHYSCIHFHENNLYASGWEGIYRYTDDGKRTAIFKGHLPQGDWVNFMIDSKNRFWVSRNGSNTIYVSAPGNTETFADSISTGTTLFSGFIEDKDHNIWIASVSGLLKVQEQQQEHFSNRDNPLIKDIRNMLETADGKLLAFSRETGVLEFNGNIFTKSALQLYNSDPAARNDFPDTYFKDERGKTWVVTREGRLLRIEDGHFIDCTHLLNGDSPFAWADFNPVTKKILLSQDTLSISNENSSSYFITRNNKSILSFPKFLKCFSNGKTLVVCENAGITLIDENNNATKVNEELGLGNANPGSLFLEDHDGGFWMFGGSYGLKHFIWNKNGLPENNMNITADNGLGDDIINSACIDAGGKIWAITSRSLIVIKIDSLNKKVFVKQLSDNSNIDIAMPANAKLFTSSDGRIWFTDKNDIYCFKPENIAFNSNTAQINIENIDVNFEKTNWGKYADSFEGYWQLPIDPVFNHNENNLQINYTGVSFTNPAELLYSYKLDGLDTNWNKPSKNTFVSYANLPAGKYSFRVRTRTPNSNWSQPAVFFFSIKPAFWNTWWFRLLTICLAAMIIIYFFRSRIKKINQEALIKNQLTEMEMTALKAQMNPHFIYNALNSIQSLVASDKKEDAIYYIGTFSRLLRKVLDQSENNIISLEKELQTIELYIGLESLRLNMKPNYVVHIADGLQTDDEKIPPLILQPFVENALWHGLSKKEGEKKIRLTIIADPLWLTCIIEDNGIGRKKAAEYKISNVLQNKSKAIEITSKRLVDFNSHKNPKPVTIEDLYDETGNASGTRVILQIRRQN